MRDRTDITEVGDALMELAKRRREAIVGGEGYDEACDALLKPLVYQSPDGDMYYGLQLPQCFPSMTEPDVLTVIEWYTGEGSVIRPGRDLLEVHANYGDILIPMHPAMRGSYRIVQIMKAQNDQVQMGDLLIILQAMAHRPLKRKTPRRKVA